MATQKGYLVVNTSKGIYNEIINRYTPVKVGKRYRDHFGFVIFSSLEEIIKYGLYEYEVYEVIFDDRDKRDILIEKKIDYNVVVNTARDYTFGESVLIDTRGIMEKIKNVI